MNFYNKVAERVEDLILGVVALGILFVSIEYVQFALEFKQQLAESRLSTEFVQRIVLFFAVLIFSSYYLISYAAYFAHKSEKNGGTKFKSSQIVILYILELLQVTVAAGLFAVVLIGDLTGINFKNYDQADTAFNLIEVTLSSIGMIYFFMIVWHSVVFIWYWLWHVFLSGKVFFIHRDLIVHSCYVATYICLFFVINYISAINLESDTLLSAVEYSFIVLYIMIVISLFLTKAIPDMDKAIDSHKEK